MINVIPSSQFAVTHEYNAFLQRLYPAPHVATPFGSALVRVPAGTTSQLHQHHEHETFVILEGEGKYAEDGEVSAFGPGDVIYITPFSEHALTAGDGDVRYISVWWEGVVPKAPAGNTCHVIFTPPPTPNGDLHLGHISGPYISADIVRRNLALQGKRARLIVGTDKNQSYVDLKARQRKTSASAVFHDYTASILATFDQACIAYDDIHDCDSASHQRFVEDFVQVMLDQALVRIAPHTSLACDHCRLEVFEAFAAGNCPHCGAVSNGCVCEDCGSPNNSYDLVDVHCNLCGGPTRSSTVDKAVLDIAACRAHFGAAGFAIAGPAKLEAYLARQATSTLEAYVVSFQAEWGLASRQPALRGQVYLGWFEMAAGYLAALYRGVFGEECTEVGPAIARLNAADYQVIHFMGFDNSFYYASLYPQILAALGLRRLRITFSVNEFLLLEQEKFSTSRNHAIWARDVFSNSATTDWYRFYLSINKPETARQNFSRNAFAAFVADAGAQLEQIVQDSRDRLGSAWEGARPEAGSWLPVHREYASFFTAQEQYLAHALSGPTCYSAKRYASGVKQLLDGVAQFQAASAGHVGAGGDAGVRRTSLAIERQALDMLRQHLPCILPSVASMLFENATGTSACMQISM